MKSTPEHHELLSHGTQPLITICMPSFLSFLPLIRKTMGRTAQLLLFYEPLAPIREVKFDPRYNVAILISSQFTLITSLNIVLNNSSNITLMMKSLLTIALLLVISPATSACGSKEVRLTTVDNQQASLRISASNYSGSARELMHMRRFPRPGVQGDYSVHKTFQSSLQTRFFHFTRNKIIRTLS